MASFLNFVRGGFQRGQKPGPDISMMEGRCLTEPGGLRFGQVIDDRRCSFPTYKGNVYDQRTGSICRLAGSHGMENGRGRDLSHVTAENMADDVTAENMTDDEDDVTAENMTDDDVTAENVTDDDEEDEIEKRSIPAPADLATVVRNLEKAISDGNFDKGVALLRVLVEGKAHVRVQVLSIGLHNHDVPFHIFVTVETETVQSGPTWKLQVRPSMTIFGLKLKVALLYDIPLSVQRWIIGRKIPGDTQTLRSNGVLANAKVFLYLLAKGKQADSTAEMMIIKGFHQELIMRDIGDIELGFTQEEYSKYLQEAKLQQQPSYDQQPQTLSLHSQQHHQQPGHHVLEQPRTHDTQQPQTHDIQQPRTHDIQQSDFYDMHPRTNEIQQPQIHDTQQPRTQETQQSHFYDMQQPRIHDPQQPRTHDTQQPRTHDTQQPRIYGMQQHRTQQPVHDDHYGSTRSLNIGGDGDHRSRTASGFDFERYKREQELIPSRDQGQLGAIFPPPHLVQRGPKQDQTADVYGEEYRSRPPRDANNYSSLHGELRPPTRSASMGDLYHGRVKAKDKRAGRRNPVIGWPEPVDPAIFQGRRHAQEGMDTISENKPCKQTMRRDDRGSVKQKDPSIRRKVPRRFREPEAKQNCEVDDAGLYFRPADPPRGLDRERQPENSRSHRTVGMQPPLGKRRRPRAEEVGWPCPACTFRNPPRVPGCRQCSSERPADYQIPRMGSYVMDKDEERIHSGREKSEVNFAQMQVLEQETQEHKARINRAHLRQATNVNVMVNEEAFECPICFSEVEPGDGIRLQECLHEICRRCCEEYIKESKVPEVKCPFTDGDNPCQQTILPREIQQIITRDEYKMFEKRSLESAEVKAANTFHCLTPNCEGFCFYDEDYNFFNCPICRSMNCLTCKVIHEGQNCKEYQDDINLKALHNQSAKQTQDALQKLLQDGRAMRCPQCGIVIQKKGGCPNMTCSVCNRGFRWTGVEM